MKTYSEWLKRFEQQELLEFSRTAEGLAWLKLRSIDRPELLKRFIASAALSIDPGKRKETVERIWKRMGEDAGLSGKLDDFLRACQTSDNANVVSSLDAIRQNLYRMTEFRWRGGFRNSLDKAIVSRYVKTPAIIPYDQLDVICRGELLAFSRCYLVNSWYDYWSTVLIENIFRQNPRVLPAPGKIKNVDFFVDDFPFDLKVTYIPREYAKSLRKELGQVEPLKALKAYAKKSGLLMDEDADDEELRYALTEQIKDSGAPEGLALLAHLASDWAALVAHVQAHKDDLITWLYENQGDMRFGSENRIFLILVDMADPAESWKLKRNIEKLQPAINGWIESFRRADAASLLRRFSYKTRRYQTYADAIFISKE